MSPKSNQIIYRGIIICLLFLEAVIIVMAVNSLTGIMGLSGTSKLCMNLILSFLFLVVLDWLFWRD